MIEREKYLLVLWKGSWNNKQDETLFKSVLFFVIRLENV
jgi:hypothetical protein